MGAWKDPEEPRKALLARLKDKDTELTETIAKIKPPYSVSQGEVAAEIKALLIIRDMLREIVSQP